MALMPHAPTMHDIGHSIEDFYVFKIKFQELLGQKLLTFIEEQPNIKRNLLPGHDGSAVNAIDEVGCT